MALLLVYLALWQTKLTLINVSIKFNVEVSSLRYLSFFFFFFLLLGRTPFKLILSWREHWISNHSAKKKKKINIVNFPSNFIRLLQIHWHMFFLLFFLKIVTKLSANYNSAFFFFFNAIQQLYFHCFFFFYLISFRVCVIGHKHKK